MTNLPCRLLYGAIFHPDGCFCKDLTAPLFRLSKTLSKCQLQSEGRRASLKSAEARKCGTRMSEPCNNFPGQGILSRNVARSVEHWIAGGTSARGIAGGRLNCHNGTSALAPKPADRRAQRECPTRSI